LGLDNAGKTTLLQMLKSNTVGTNSPTLFPNNEELIIQGIRFRTFDLGGHETARRIWKDYLTSVDGVVFIVDAADRTRFAEARIEIQNLLDDPALARVPFAILGNKIDIPVAVSEDELRNSLRLHTHMTAGKHVVKGDETCRPIEVFMCSIVKRMGYAEAFDWLAKLV
jgi:GTP-binding protein SAR1